MSAGSKMIFKKKFVTFILLLLLRFELKEDAINKLRQDYWEFDVITLNEENSVRKSVPSQILGVFLLK